MSPKFSTKKAQSGQLIKLEKVESNVRYGSLADRLISPRHVRFTPNNGRWAAHPSQHLAVPSGWCSPHCRCFL